MWVLMTANAVADVEANFLGDRPSLILRCTVVTPYIPQWLRHTSTRASVTSWFLIVYPFHLWWVFQSFGSRFATAAFTFWASCCVWPGSSSVLWGTSASKTSMVRQFKRFLIVIFLQEHRKHTPCTPGKSSIMGDVLCLLGAGGYALSNCIQQKIMQSGLQDCTHIALSPFLRSVVGVQ